MYFTKAMFAGAVAVAIFLMKVQCSVTPNAEKVTGMI